MGPKVSFSSLKVVKVEWHWLARSSCVDTLRIMGLIQFNLMQNIAWMLLAVCLLTHGRYTLCLILYHIGIMLGLAKHLGSCKQNPHSLTGFFFSKSDSALKKITQQHIEESNSVKQLVKGCDLFRLTEQPVFRPFMRRLAQLLLSRAIDRESMECVDMLLHEIRRFSSAELHSNSSDIVNYQLLFKQLTRHLPDTYSMEGFEYRATMVAEPLPRIAVFDGCQPAAISLLHYMSTYSAISKGELKKNLLNYFIRYFLFQRYTTTTTSQNESANNAKTGSQAQMVDPNVALILISCSEARQSKTSLCSMIDSIALLNVRKQVHLYRKHYGLEEPLLFYLRELKAKQLLDMSAEEKSALKASISKVDFLTGIETDGALVVNTEEKLLQTADLLIRLISKEYINIIGNQMGTACIMELASYFYLLIAASEDMSIHVRSAPPKSSYESEAKLQQKAGEYKSAVKQVKLWKIAAQILKSLACNQVYVHRKDELAKLILHKLVRFIKKQVTITSSKDYESDNGEHSIQGEESKKVRVTVKAKPSLRQSLKGLESTFLKLITYIPVDTLRMYREGEQHLHELLCAVMKQCTKELPGEKQQADELCSAFIKMIELKKALLASRKQLASMFRALVKQDTKFELWRVYFFLGSTSDPVFIKQIPFEAMITHLSATRSQLQSSCKYLHQMHKLNDEGKSGVGLTSIKSTHKWQLSLLRLHALALLSNQGQALPNLLALHCKTYKISVKQIDVLLSQWLQPYKPHDTSKQNEEKKLVSQPIVIYEKYFNEVFHETQCYHQPQLVDLILNHPVFQNYMLHWQTHSKENFFVYFLTVLLGLGDSARKQQYLAKYSLDKTLPKDIKANRIFHASMGDVVPLFTSIEQFDMLLDCLNRLNSVNQYKDALLKIVTQQQVRRHVSYELQSKPRPKEELIKSDGKQGSKNKPKASVNPQHPNKQFDLSPVTYEEIVSESGKTSQFYWRVHSKIIDSLIKDYENPLNYSNSLTRRFALLVNYIEFVCRHCTIDADADAHLKTIAKKVNELLLNKKMEDEFELANSVFKLRITGLLDEDRVALHLLKSTPFKLKSLFKLLCLCIVGREKAITHQLASAAEWAQYQNEAYKASSQSKDSLIWLIIAIRMSSPPRFNGLLKKLKNISDPFERKIVFNELKKFQQRHELLNCQLNFQELTYQQSIETAAQRQAQREATSDSDDAKKKSEDESRQEGTPNTRGKKFNRNDSEQTGDRVLKKPKKNPLFQGRKP